MAHTQMTELQTQTKQDPPHWERLAAISTASDTKMKPLLHQLPKRHSCGELLWQCLHVCLQGVTSPDDHP